jgi:hypothetical protein
VTRAAAAAVLLAAFAAGCASPALFSACLPANRDFRIEYLHSVERTPISETYTVAANGEITVREMRFRSGGAGLPSSGYVREGDWFVLRRVNRRVGVLALQLGRGASHVVIVGSRAFALGPMVPKGGNVSLRGVPSRDCALRLEARNHGR